jgi:hypothetical protein
MTQGGNVMNVKYNFKLTFYCDGKYKEERLSISGDFNTQIAWLDAVKQSVITATENNMRLIKISLVNIEEV